VVLDEESNDTLQSRIVFDSLIESSVSQFADVREAGACHDDQLGF
jgi:hypothetical protein